MKQQKSKQRRATRRWRWTAAKRRGSSTVVCISNTDYPASLEKLKIYLMLRDVAAEKHGLIRIVDESGDGYLYPKMLFRSIVLPQAVKKAMSAAA